jgi:hypothetical protein
MRLEVGLEMFAVAITVRGLVATDMAAMLVVGLTSLSLKVTTAAPTSRLVSSTLLDPLTVLGVSATTAAIGLVPSILRGTGIAGLKVASTASARPLVPGTLRGSEITGLENTSTASASPLISGTLCGVGVGDLAALEVSAAAPTRNLVPSVLRGSGNNVGLTSLKDPTAAVLRRLISSALHGITVANFLAFTLQYSTPAPLRALVSAS